MILFKSKTYNFILLATILAIITTFRILLVIRQGNFGLAHFPDEINYYLAGAKSFNEQGWGYFLTERSLWNAPLSVLWIVLFNSNIALLQIVNTILVSSTALLLYDLCRLYANQRVAWASIVFHLCYLPFNEFSATLLAEGPTTFLIILTVWCCARYNSTWLSGVCLGLATLFRPTTQIFPLLLIFASVFSRFLRRPALIFFVGAMLLILPYSIKNYVNFGTTSIATGLGAVLHLGSDLRIHGNEPVYYGLNFDTSRITKSSTHLDLVGDRALQIAAIDNIKIQPFATAKLYVEKFFRLMFGSSLAIFYPYKSLADWPIKNPAVWYGILLPMFCQIFIFVAWLFGIHNYKKPAEQLASGLVIYFLLLHSLLFAIPRMLMPVYPLAIFLGLKSLTTKKAISATVVSLLIAVWLCWQHYWINPAIVSNSYVQSFSSRADFNQELTSTNNKKHYLLQPINTLEYLTNQVLIANIKCGDFSKARRKAQLVWKDNNKVAIQLEAGQQLYRFSLSRQPDWHGPLEQLEIRTPKACELLEAYVLR